MPPDASRGHIIFPGDVIVEYCETNLLTHGDSSQDLASRTVAEMDDQKSLTH